MAPISKFATVIVRRTVNASAAHTWDRVGGYADAGRFLDIPCVLIEGDGNLGSVRRIFDTTIEVMVGQGATSYTYSQTEGPMAARSYHGFVGVEPVDARRCDLTWAVTYDQSGSTEEERAADRAHFTDRFARGVAVMKADAEAV